MDYQIKPIYSVSNSLGGDSTWCSNPESLVLAIHNDENVGCSGDGYIQEQDDTEELFQNKVSKKNRNLFRRQLNKDMPNF